MTVYQFAPHVHTWIMGAISIVFVGLSAYVFTQMDKLNKKLLEEEAILHQNVDLTKEGPPTTTSIPPKTTASAAAGNPPSTTITNPRVSKSAMEYAPLSYSLYNDLGGYTQNQIYLIRSFMIVIMALSSLSAVVCLYLTFIHAQSRDYNRRDYLSDVGRRDSVMRDTVRNFFTPGVFGMIFLIVAIFSSISVAWIYEIDAKMESSPYFNANSPISKVDMRQIRDILFAMVSMSGLGGLVYSIMGIKNTFFSFRFGWK